MATVHKTGITNQNTQFALQITSTKGLQCKLVSDVNVTDPSLFLHRMLEVPFYIPG